MLRSIFRRANEKPSVKTSAAVELRKTALNSVHRRLGAKMVNFGGWDMPLEYSGIIAEHRAVRTRAGLFDVSHMGELGIRGPGALQLVQWVSCNNAAKLNVGQARYSQLAIQGPRATEILQKLTPAPLESVRYYHFTFGNVSGVDCLIARTGYTGEDGFEIYFAPEQSVKLWTDLMQAGETAEMIPCGLGARNTLRLEAGMCLYGHEIDDTTTPWEAGLAWICKME